MRIDHELVQKLATLARLELEPEEEAAFAEQLPAIVEYVGRLQTANVETVTAEPPADLPLRIDAAIGRSTPDVLLAQAPVRQDDFWKVDSVKG